MKKLEIDGDIIYLKKSKYFGWGVIKPLKNEDGSLNWFNLLTGGNILTFIFTLVLVISLIGAIFEYTSAINTANQCLQLNNAFKLIP